MTDTVIKVENLSKQYRLGQIGSGTIRDDFSRFWARMRGKEDPTLKIGQANTLSSNSQLTTLNSQLSTPNSKLQTLNSNYVWALRDINFEVKQGEVLGIIGKNGAGKSTLLKILSKVTAPTTGSVKVKGRIASLLEVGTGFHPELSGRENIFLNGAILGMTKAEIRSKFDEIVDFAGVERYIDTPVKRYSSGMYVRLAFAVAAHLEPEILVVDEVLAVGDAEFQKKALGKMQDVSRSEGRTVLFVSHNMSAISELCTKSLLLSNGEIAANGITNLIIDKYISNTKLNNTRIWELKNAPGNNVIKIIKVYFLNDKNEKISKAFITDRIGIYFEYVVLENIPFFVHGINVFNKMDLHLFTSHELVEYNPNIIIKKGTYSIIVWLPSNLLQEGEIRISFACMRYNPFEILINEANIVGLFIIDKLEGSSRNASYKGHLPGLVRPLLKWEKSRLIKNSI